jgi:hypothetical protein
MAKRVAHDWFSPLLLLLCCAAMIAGVLSGRWGFEWSWPMWGNGSQWHLHLRYGTVRFITAGSNSDFAGLPAGAKIDDMASWRWEWDVSIMTTGTIRTIQIPLWFLTLFLAAWFTARVARRNLRKAAGLCPGCGKTVGGGIDKCPKCGTVIRPRQMTS